MSTSIFQKKVRYIFLFISIFSVLFLAGAQYVHAATPICTIKHVGTSPTDIKSTEKITCPIGTVTYIQFEDNKCYFQNISIEAGVQVDSTWKREACPGEPPLETSRATPVPGTYTFIANTDSVTLTAYLDTSKNPGFKNFKSYFQWAPAPIAGINNPAAKSFEEFTDTVPAKVAASKINDFASYGIKITNITPNVAYNLRETIINDDNIAPTTDPVAVKDTTFVSDGGKGVGVKQDFDIQKDFEDRSYRLLAPFPGLTVLMDPDLCAEQAAIGNTGNICDLNDFINFALLLLVGLGAVLLVFRIVLEGFKYVTSDVISIKIGSKQAIWDAALGLLLVLSAFIILNTINPRLVENTFNIQRLEISSEITYIPTEVYESITGEPLKTKSEYAELVKKIAKEKGIEACIVQATIDAEATNWDPRSVGCDENVRKAGVPSRKAFIQSGILLNGNKFTPTSNVGASIKNDCTFDNTKPGYGLDWRFSKGGGLMQVTLFPENYDTSAWYQSVKEGGAHWNNRNTPFPGFEALFKPEENIRKGIDILQGNLRKCNGGVEKAFRAYQSGSCEPKGNKLVETTVSKKMAAYNACRSAK